MKILILLFSPPTGTWGSLTRMLSIANEFLNQNDDVAFCAGGYLKESLIRKGFKAYEMPLSTMFGRPKFISKIIEKRSQNMSPPVKEGKSIGNVWFVHFITGMTRKKYLLNLVENQINAVKEFKPDILLTEMDPGAYIVTEITGIPLVSTYASIAEGGFDSFSYKRVRRAGTYVLKHYNGQLFEPKDLCFGKRVFKLIPSIPELDGTDEGRDDICYTGSLLNNLNLSKESDIKIDKNKKYIFVYLGTGSISLKKIKKILIEIFAVYYDFKCIVCSQIINKSEIYKNIEFHNFIPAFKVLPFCKWTICHGGHNTIIQSLINFVPLILFPGPIFERRFNASMISRNKAGVMGELSDFNVKWLRNVINKFDLYSENALKLGKKIISYGGSKKAVIKIKDWYKHKNNDK